jgi:hypothetical protein
MRGKLRAERHRSSLAAVTNPVGETLRAMLEYKGIDFKRTDLVPFLSRVILRKVLGFTRNTVPAIKIDG